MTSRCLVYLCSRRSRREVLRGLARRTGLHVESEQHVYTLTFPGGYFGLHLNETAATPGTPIEARDYRRFPYVLDLMYEAPDWPDHDVPMALHDALDARLAPFVIDVLDYFWSHQEAAVAECGFEEALPFSGGREKVDQPWPSEGVAPG